MWVTLDGVVQGLGRPDEDTRGGFTHGGWGPRYNDEVMGREMAAAMARPGDMLFGRRTWQDFIVSLVRSLHAAGLIDHYTLLICPLTLGSGTRLFGAPAPPTEFELTGSVTTTTGVIIAQYARSGRRSSG
jgi:dihydrofolate reductase